MEKIAEFMGQANIFEFYNIYIYISLFFVQKSKKEKELFKESVLKFFKKGKKGSPQVLLHWEWIFHIFFPINFQSFSLSCKLSL